MAAKKSHPKLLGRHKTPCLCCGFESVHVKVNDDKHPYIYCPECGMTVPTRNGRQASGLMAGLRPELHTNAPELVRRADDIVVPAPAAPAPPAAAAPPAPKRRGAWPTLIDSLK